MLLFLSVVMLNKLCYCVVDTICGMICYLQVVIDHAWGGGDHVIDDKIVGFGVSECPIGVTSCVHIA